MKVHSETRILKAVSFYTRSQTATSYEQKLLCLYDSLCILLDGDVVPKACQACGMEENAFKTAVDYCRGDCEVSRIVLDENQMASLDRLCLQEISDI